jgi:hypothetical protein
LTSAAPSLSFRLDDAGWVSIHRMLASARDRSGSILQGIAGLEAGHDIVITLKRD